MSSDKRYVVESKFHFGDYQCVVVFSRSGHRCGYVGVIKGHPFYGKDYGEKLDILPMKQLLTQNLDKRSPITLLNIDPDSETAALQDFFNVHGGITYADGGPQSDYPIDSDRWWLGFDCAHAGDMADEESWKKYFPNEITTPPIFFSGEIRKLDYVENECRSLVRQIEDVLKNENIEVKN